MSRGVPCLLMRGGSAWRVGARLRPPPVRWQPAWRFPARAPIRAPSTRTCSAARAAAPPPPPSQPAAVSSSQVYWARANKMRRTESVIEKRRRHVQRTHTPRAESGFATSFRLRARAHVRWFNAMWEQNTHGTRAGEQARLLACQVPRRACPVA